MRTDASEGETATALTQLELVSRTYVRFSVR